MILIEVLSIVRADNSVNSSVVEKMYLLNCKFLTISQMT